MLLAQWFRPPGRTLVVFLGLMLVLGSALGWLGWQVIQRDRLVERSQLLERLERSADHIVTVLQRSLSEFDRLATAAPDSEPEALPEGVVILRATRLGVTVRPDPTLLFHPAGAPPSEPEPLAGG
jgi:hypothetical protein